MRLNNSILKEIGEGIVERAVDVVLLMVYFNLEAPSLLRNKRYMIEGRVNEDLEEFDYQKLKRAFYYLKNKGLISFLKEKNSLPKITLSGEKRLKSILPFYDEKRIWDRKIYLVTYDIPEKERKIRNYLRDYLKKVGCGMLQQSIWITPYNPTSLIRKFVEEHMMDEGLILVSSIGKDGTVGQMTLPDLMEKVYKLSVLSQRYREFVALFAGGKTNRSQLIFHFLSILKDDPQLPFPMLPKNWVGDKAYQIFENLHSSCL